MRKCSNCKLRKENYMTELQKKGLYSDVLGALKSIVNDIYTDFANAMEIADFENPIDYAQPEISATEKLAKAITETLIWNKERE